MKIKKNDIVEVRTGKSRGKRGKVLRVYPETNKLLIEGVNVMKKHERPSAKNQQGGITEKEFPIAASNVMIVDPKSDGVTRIGRRETKDATGKKRFERFARKSGQPIA
jgi:large subunit ribosomal protein L24